MKRKLICLLMLLALALAAIAGCQPTEKTPEPDNGPFDASKGPLSGSGVFSVGWHPAIAASANARSISKHISFLFILTSCYHLNQL